MWLEHLTVVIQVLLVLTCLYGLRAVWRGMRRNRVSKWRFLTRRVR